MSESLKVNTTLTMLSLEREQQQKTRCKNAASSTAISKAENNIHEGGTSALSEALKVNTTLTALDMVGVIKHQDNVKQVYGSFNNKQGTRSTLKVHVRWARH